MSHTLASTDGLTPRAVRARIVASITATTGWNLSRHVWDDFPGAPDTRHLEHLAFAAGVVATDPIGGDRQRRSVGMLCVSSVSLRFGYRIRADASSADYDAALDAESDMVACLRNVTTDPELDVTIDGISRQVNDLFFLGEIACSVIHRYPLS